jgi:hypothetical protein
MLWVCRCCCCRDSFFYIWTSNAIKGRIFAFSEDSYNNQLSMGMMGVGG